MARETALQAIRRIAAHARENQLRSIKIIFHGGEPLLAGKEFFSFAASEFRAAVPAGTRLEMSVQTNGTLLDEPYLAVLGAAGIRVGVSLDGGPGSHDRSRPFAGGRGSHDEVVRALRLLGSDPYRELFAGLLCTIDLRSDPVETYTELLRHAPPEVDFLLPHGNWSRPPPGRDPTSISTPYGDWLAALFDHWYAAGRPRADIRLLREIIHLTLGGRSRTEAIGLTPACLLVVETDGTLEQVDALKTAYHGAAATGLNIFDHSLAEALHHPGVVARQLGLTALGTQCRECEVRRICGGGYYPHRYRAGAGFRNPSVYCPDLLRLIRHVQQRIRLDMSELRRRAEH
jgi:uncharacterized protein